MIKDKSYDCLDNNVIKQVKLRPTARNCGYQFLVDTGPMGANWFFKDGDRSDPWGCRVSAKSLALASQGAEEMKLRCDRFLSDLGVTYGPGDCRLSRLDFAVDFLRLLRRIVYFGSVIFKLLIISCSLKRVSYLLIFMLFRAELIHFEY